MDKSLKNRETYYFSDLQRELYQRKYSCKTMKAYLHYNRELLKITKNTPHMISNKDIRDYLFYLAYKKNLSASTLNGAINALKFYYGAVLNKSFIYSIKRPKKDKTLPSILSADEIKKLFSAVTNIKHKALIMLVYSSGLRVSEVVKIKPEDIDQTRKLIHIKGGKGRKDRYILLSDFVLCELRNYYKIYRPKIWLFNGINPSDHLSIRSAQSVFKKAKIKAGIKKDVSIHSLRHSFATHLLESGVDMRYIQEILGHKSSKTTEIYTHVSKGNLSLIKSPLDRMFKSKLTK